MKILRKIRNWLARPVRWLYGPWPDPPELQDPNRLDPIYPDPTRRIG